MGIKGIVIIIILMLVGISYGVYTINLNHAKKATAFYYGGERQEALNELSKTK